MSVVLPSATVIGKTPSLAVFTMSPGTFWIMRTAAAGTRRWRPVPRVVGRLAFQVLSYDGQSMSCNEGRFDVGLIWMMDAAGDYYEKGSDPCSP